MNYAISCPVCNSPIKYIGEANYYTRDSKFTTPMYECRECDLYYRSVDSSLLDDHYYAASYVQVTNESRFREQRLNFFRYIIDLIDKTTRKQDATKPGILLDFGSAYGHLLEVAAERGYQSIGVELNQGLVKYCNNKGFKTVSSLDDITSPVDVVTLIDSLYCVAKPTEILARIHDLMKPEGILLIRITNRNLYVRLRRFFLQNSDMNLVGDATVSYSLKSISRLLENSGFEVNTVIPDTGRGKHQSIKMQVFYSITSAFSFVTANRWIFAPGIIVIAKAGVGSKHNMKDLPHDFEQHSLAK